MSSKKNSSKPLDTNDQEQATVIGLNSVKNLLGHEYQLNLFDDDYVQSFSKTYGVKVQEKIDRFGIDLTDIQARMMEGVLRGFTLTNYKGNMAPIEKANLIQDKYAFGDLPSTYKYVNKIPCLKATQSQILKWAGINVNSIAEKERALEALKHLATAQYCFYYDRLALDKNGKPEKGTDGKWKQEEVMAIDTLFVIKEIRNKPNGNLEYYEIIPSPIFLDQRESNFMLIPYNWREEVRAVVGSRKASSYTFRFLLFLRYQYELMRRSHPEEAKSFKIVRNWEEVAIAIKMPESVYKRKKERALKILDDACFVAKELGYLLDYSREGALVSLILNEQKYYSSEINSYEEGQKKIIHQFSINAHQLWDFFQEEKQKNDPKHKISESLKSAHLREFENLLQAWPKEEIMKVISWGLRLKLWHSRLSSPAKLRQNISAAIEEMKNLQNDSNYG